jgi:hypothetical protein
MTLSRRLFCGVGVVAVVVAVPVERVSAGPEVAGAVAAGVRAADSIHPVEINRRSSAPMYGIARMPLEPEELAMQRVLEREVGPAVALDRETAGMNQFEQAVFCGVCDTNATEALESPLPTSWTQWGDAFFNRSDAVSGKWLRDQGCFIIIACAGQSNPANALRLPAAFDYTASLPAFKVCGYFSNFNAPNDVAGIQPITLFDVPPNPSGSTFTPSNPVACAFLESNPPAVVNNQRDQDVILFRVPAGGISNFRLFVTGGQEFIASLGCNKNFPRPGDINSCYVNPINPASPSSEYGFLATYFGETAITNPDSTTGDGYEGAKNSTWAFPRRGPVGILPEGTYVITIRTKAFASLVPPSTPTPPGTRYQIQIVGTLAAGGPGIGACCGLTTNVCVDNQTSLQCTALAGVWRGDGTTCASINVGAVPCNLTACAGTPEGPSRDCPTDTDLNRGCAESPAGGFDPITPGQTVCGYSGWNIPGSGVSAGDEDWYIYENATVEAQRVRFMLDTEYPSRFEVYYAGLGGGGLCDRAYGFGTEFEGPVREAELELCIVPGQRVLVRLVATLSPLPCGSPGGAAYRLSLETSACDPVACCSLAGVCSMQTGPACYASGGIGLGGGATCLNVPCCSGTSVCTGSTISENALPRINSVGTSDVCITPANFAGYLDTFNSGCETTAAAFSNASVGVKVCGTLSAYQGVVDTDWYQVTTIGLDSYLAIILKGQVDMDVELYKKPVGVVCPSTFAEMSSLLLQGDAYNACDSTSTIIGDCLPAGTYYIRVLTRYSNVFGVPCAGGSPGANYLMEIFQGVCTGTAVSCTGSPENEALCQNANTNGGCNTAPTPNFGAIACTGTVCGTADYLSGVRDTDWYKLTHPGGALTVNFQSAFYGEVTVLKPGASGPSGCDDFIVVDGRGFVNPNAPTTFTILSLAAGTYWVVVAPDFDGTKRVCCASGSNYRLNVVCTPPCACFFDLVANDCIVNTADLVAILGQFGRLCTSLPPQSKCADGNNDGVVNTVDLAAFLGQFGKNGNVTPGVCR